MKNLPEDIKESLKSWRPTLGDANDIEIAKIINTPDSRLRDKETKINKLRYLLCQKKN